MAMPLLLELGPHGAALIAGKAAARLHFALGRDDQCLPRPFAVILFEPDAVPRIAGQRFGPFDRGEMVPVQRHREIVADEQITMEKIAPVDDAIEFLGQFLDRLQPLVGCPAGIAEG